VFTHRPGHSVLVIVHLGSAQAQGATSEVGQEVLDLVVLVGAEGVMEFTPGPCSRLHVGSEDLPYLQLTIRSRSLDLEVRTHRLDADLPLYLEQGHPVGEELLRSGGPQCSSEFLLGHGAPTVGQRKGENVTVTRSSGRRGSKDGGVTTS
jgi:hypothetical protein